MNAGDAAPIVPAKGRPAMPTIRRSPALEAEYERLFAACAIRPARAAAVEKTVARIAAARATYAAALEGVPWHVVGILHALEADGAFDRHLHNGDPLSARTTRVPAGRPPGGTPPFTWAESAADALALKGLHRVGAWTLGRTLFEFERFNGFGYRLYHPEVLSPYLWSFSNHYARGKYVADGRWSATAVSAQPGAAVLLRRMAELGWVTFGGPAPGAASEAPPPVPFAPRSHHRPARRLQRWLNERARLFVKIDGKAGRRTSDAWQKLTGRYLPGDRRRA